jgi:amino acid permease
MLTTVMIIRTIIGGAILGLPYVVSKCGVVFATIVTFFATAANQFSSDLLLKAKNLSGHSNYSTILYHIYNHKFSKALGSILIFLNSIGVCNQ